VTNYAIAKKHHVNMLSSEVHWESPKDETDINTISEARGKPSP